MGITEQEQKNSPTTTTANGKMDITEPEQKLQQQSEKSPKESSTNKTTTTPGTLDQSNKLYHIYMYHNNSEYLFLFRATNERYCQVCDPKC